VKIGAYPEGRLSGMQVFPAALFLLMPFLLFTVTVQRHRCHNKRFFSVKPWEIG
jgi:hypothetical protein